MLTHGTDDMAVPVHYSIEAAGAYHDARHVLIEHDDHCYRQHLDKVCDAVRVFLQEV